MVKSVHFNDDIPENHNVYISNLRGKYAMIYVNEEYKAKNESGG